MTKREEKENFTSKRLRVQVCLTKDTQSLSGIFTYIKVQLGYFYWYVKLEVSKKKIYSKKDAEIAFHKCYISTLFRSNNELEF